MEDFVDDRLVGVQVLDERLEATFVLEQLFLATALIAQNDADARVQEGQFAQALGQDVPAEVNVGEGLCRSLEVHLGTGTFGLADRAQGELWNTMTIDLLPDLTGTADGQTEFFRKGVHYRHTHTVQTAGYLVGVVVELTACVQHGHDDLRGRNPFLLMDIHRNSATIVAHGDGLIGMDGDADLRAEAGERFVDRVVDNFEHHMVQTGAIVGVADVHTGAFAYGIQSLQHLDAGRVVRFVLAHASLPMIVGLIQPCSTWNMATGVSLCQPSLRNSWSTQVMNTWQSKPSSNRQSACRCCSSNSDGKSSTR
ncbi:hypothetical protein D3C84_630120 [compost metagenome]